MEFVDLLFYPFHLLMDIWWVRLLATFLYVLFMFIFMPVMLISLGWGMMKIFILWLLTLRYTRSLVIIFCCFGSMWYLYVMCLS